MPTRSQPSKQKSGASKAGIYVLVGAVLLILAATAAVLFGRGVSSQPQDETGDYIPAVPMAVDFPAPELDLTDMDGKPVSLRDYAGQVVLLNNWAFWCPPCRAELPALEDYYQDQRDNGFVIVAIEAGGKLEDVAYHVDLFELDISGLDGPRNTSTADFQEWQSAKLIFD